MIERAGALGWALRSCGTEAMLSFARLHGVELDGPAPIDVSRGPVWSKKTRGIWVTYPAGWVAGIEALMAKTAKVRRSEVWREAFLRWVDEPLPPAAVERLAAMKAAEAPQKAAKPKRAPATAA